MPILAAVLGVVIGLVIGSFGGGGGVLVVPTLVYLLGQTAQHATTSSIVIVGITAITGSLARLRDRRIDWPTGCAFSVAGTPAAYLGTLLNHRVAERVLLSAFAALAVLAAAAMLVDSRPHPAPGAPTRRSHQPPAGGTGTPVASRRGRRSRRRAVTVLVGKALPLGLLTGFLTGFLGVGGGFLVVPALVVALRVPMTTAVGTSLLIMVCNSVTSLLSRLPVTGLQWRIVLPFAVAAVVGSMLGKRVADRLSSVVLTRAFAVMLAVVGGLVAAQSLGAF